jgi:hypothetical protein
MLQIELQLLRAGVQATEARRLASQFQGQLEVTQAASQFQSIRQSLISQEQLELESYNTRLLQLQTFGQARQDMAVQVNALIEAETARHTAALAQIEVQRNQMIVGAMTTVLGTTQQQLQILGQRSKAFALAAVVIGKGLAIATTIQQGIAASTAALAPPPVGLGPVAGAPLAAAIRGLTAANVALIAATGITEGRQALSGGGAPSGGGGGGSTTIPDDDDGPPQRIIIESVDPAAIFTGEQLNGLIDAINSQAENGRIVVANKVI